jgi:hypothetical protein
MRAQWDRAFRALAGSVGGAEDLAWELFRGATEHEVTHKWDVGVFNSAIKAVRALVCVQRRR